MSIATLDLDPTKLLKNKAIKTKSLSILNLERSIFENIDLSKIGIISENFLNNTLVLSTNNQTESLLGRDTANKDILLDSSLGSDEFTNIDLSTSANSFNNSLVPGITNQTESLLGRDTSNREILPGSNLGSDEFTSIDLSISANFLNNSLLGGTDNFLGNGIGSFVDFQSITAGITQNSLVATPRQINVPQLSCAGIGNSLNNNQLFARSASTILQDYRTAFEIFSLASFGIQRTANIPTFQPIPSPDRRAFSGGKASSVIPDGIGSVTYIDANGVPQTFNNSVFYEAKTKVRVNQSTDDYQPVGYVDVLSRSPAAIRRNQLNSPPYPIPALFYLTPSSTRIGNDVIQRATAERVAIFQHIACDNPGGTLGTNDTVMGRGIPLNPQVYTSVGMFNPVPAPAGTPGTIG